MSPREQKLLIFFALAGFAILNLLAFNFAQTKRLEVNAKRNQAKLALDTAEMFRESSAQVTDQMNWLADHEPQPATNQDVQTSLQQLTEREARSAGLTIKTQKPLPTDAGEGKHYHRAKIQITVSGAEEALYRWFDKLNSPDQLRIASEIRLTPNQQDDTKIDCTATIEQWFVPQPPDVKFQIPNLKFQILILLALTGWACADLPKKAPISRYTTLWTNSPFTSKPPPPEAVDAPNPLDDYALIGVSSLGSGTFRVTILNKKKPDEPRKYIDSNQTKDGFRILEVIRKPGDPTGTTVRMQSGSLTGTIRYDEKLLALTPAAPQAPPGVVNPPGVPTQPVPQPVDPNGQPMRQPRPRVVPPAPPQPGVPNQAGQPQPQNQQRPVRRGN